MSKHYSAGADFPARLLGSMHISGETVHTLSKKVCVSPATISRYCSGKMQPKAVTITALAEVFGVDNEWLAGNTQAKKECKDMNQLYWCIKHIHEAQDIEEAAELVNSGWVVILILKHKDRPHSFICGTDRDVDMEKLFGDTAVPNH